LLAVMGFENASDPQDSEQLGGMLARLLGTHLAAGEGPDVLSPQRLHDAARQAGAPDGRVGRDLASEVARRAGVTTMVLGRIEAVPDGLLASAEVVDVASGRTLLAPRARGAGPPDLFSMAESLSRQVREGLREPAMTADERAALAGQLTTSLEAFRAYVRGLEALLRNNPHEASAALSEATRLDPAFALAHLRLGLACVWTGDGQRGEAAFERALAFRDRLPPELQRLVDVLRPYYSSNDDTRTALPLLLEALESDPHEHDVLYMLGEIYTHSATRADPARAAEMFERLLALDPGLSLVYEHLLTALLRGGRADAARAQLEAWRPRQPANLAELEGTLALWEGRLDDAARGLRDPLIPEFLAGRTDAPALRAVLAADLAGQRQAATALQGVYRIVALDLRAAVLAAHGRFEEAADLYAQAAAEHDFVSVDSFMTSVRNVARQHHAQLLAAAGDLDGARALAEHVRAEQPDTFRAPWFAARLALQAGDAGHARAQLARLEDLAARGWGPSATLYRDALAAELLLHDGRAGLARAAFAALVGSGRLMEDWYTCEDSPGPLLREGLARACLADGDAAAASEAMDGLIGAGFERLRQPVPWVLAHFERGRLLLSMGRDAEGRALLERFLAHWGSADREIPEVVSARQLLGH
jgi:tetratricopeptide (TPR) repeat protein